MLDSSEDSDNKISASGSSKTHIREARAMARTPADIMEHPDSYVFFIDMPGMKSGDIKVQVEYNSR